MTETKTMQAMRLFKQNPGMPNADFVKLLMSEVGMSKAGARTYSYNVRNGKANSAPSKPAATKTTDVKEADTAAKEAEAKAPTTAKAKTKGGNVVTLNKIKEAAAKRKNKSTEVKMDPNGNGTDPVESAEVRKQQYAAEEAAKTETLETA